MTGRILALTLRATICIFLFYIGIWAQSDLRAPATVNSLEAARWQQDLRHLALEMPRRHKNLFHTMSREQFESAVKRLDERIPTLARHQIIVEMMRIVAMVGDGHTSLNPEFNPKIGFRVYPIKVYLFADGLFVESADPKHADAVGARIIKLGTATAEQAFKTVSEVVPRDNEMTLKQRVPSFMVIPEVLHALGLIHEMEKAPMLIEKDGKQITVLLEPAGKIRQRSHGPDEQDPTAGWVKMVDGATSAPLWQKAPHVNYWFEYLEDSKTLYVQYNSVFNKKDETIAEFFRRVFAFVDSHPVDRFVLDVRLNEGGEGFLNKPILLGLIKSEKVNRRGHLFTVVGRGTFSAAQLLVNELEQYTNTLFVGEPTGARVNFYGDHALVELPNSGLTVAASSIWWQTMNPRDRRPWITPQIATEMTSNDYLRNIDPALNAILSYRSIVEALAPALHANNIALTIRQYREFKSDPQTRSINTESEINALGYQFLSMNRAELAIEIFKLNVESYPKSANVYDSLGDAYSQNGNREQAIKYYEKALELSPQSAHTAEKLRHLRNR